MPEPWAASLLAALLYLAYLAWRAWRARRRSRGPARIVPGVVLVLAQPPYQAALADLVGLLRVRTAGSPLLALDLGAESDAGRSDRPRLAEVFCVPGREAEAVRLLRAALAGPDRGRILVSREPEIRWESVPGPVGPITGPALERVLALALPQAGPDPGSATVVVVDAGIDDAACRALAGGDLVQPLRHARLPSSDGAESGDHGGHGTAVIAAIHAAAPKTPIRWVAVPGRSRGRAAFLARVLRVVEALAEQGPVVANLSWSWAVEDLDEEDDFDGLADVLFDQAVETGAVLVAAAGNVERYRPATPMGFPARHRRVVAVGAADEHGARVARSCYGGKPARPAPAFLVAGPVDRTGRPGPLVSVGRTDHAGTSLATAVASGVIARSGLVTTGLPPTVDPAGLDAWVADRLEALDVLGDPTRIAGYRPEEHGEGLLRLPPP